MENKITYYTAEKFAKRAGVTSRTLRYYDKIGLLKPSKHTESGYRLYCDEDMIRLQRIIALRYLQFSLPEIQLTLEKDEAKGVLDSLRSQREAFEKERDHLEHIIGTIRRLEENQGCSWQDLTRLIQMINSNEEIQWRFVESWRKEREELFDSKKSNPEGWRQFVFRQLKIQEGERILEPDTNDGALWRRNAHQLPKCHITQTVLDQIAKENLNAK
ncbi:MAG: MerR family transcriptional regulator, partial [Firmicutes bacterium]|nr:MerR family transcriptional regulator [Bacillota bacterium]